MMMQTESNISLMQTSAEKPQHYTYLKEFRTSQCPLFLQHKCTQHRPFTCFHWHFMNQRRRRPIRKRDGTFSYSPDHYCAKYDETTGICPDGDDCPYLHRTAGDTERRYHLRYYKTGTCVHETDARGHCSKNGPHCAFAHGAHDLRPAVYDIREVQTMELGVERADLTPVGTPSSLEKERVLLDDPNWNDTTFVLACYKTEPCKRPPRLCRQGYACPQFHNSRDRRRSPKKYKYRSTPCPHVKHGDDWGDPGQCETADDCSYCHTRTEQQFHPEIYKSTKCNDMAQTAYCPRGPFCAFAHVDQEMTSNRDLHMGSDNSLAAFVSNVLPNVPEFDLVPSLASQQYSTGLMDTSKLHLQSNTWTDQSTNAMTSVVGSSTSSSSCSSGGTLISQQNKRAGFAAVVAAHSTNSAAVAGSMGPGGITHQRHNAVLSGNSSPGSGHMSPHSSGITVPSSGTSLLPGKNRLSSSTPSTNVDLGFGLQYQRAPGSEREDSRRHHSLSIDGDLMAPHPQHQQSTLFGLSDLGSVTSSTPPAAIMSPHAPSFYPAGETVESVIGNALEDIIIDDFDLSSLDKELEKEETNSMSSSYGAGFSTSDFNSYLGATSVPVNIPNRNNHYRGSLGSLSQSPSSPMGSSDQSQLSSLPRQQHQQQQLQQLQQQQKQEQMIEQAAAAFHRQPNPGKYSSPAQPNGADQSNTVSLVQSALILGSPMTSSTMSPSSMVSEYNRLREELITNKAKLSSWEEGISQARNACEAWRREAEESTKKAKLYEEERNKAVKFRDEALQQLDTTNKEVQNSCGCSWLHSVQNVDNLDAFPRQQLLLVKQQLVKDAERVDKVISLRSGQVSSSTIKCLNCKDEARTLVVLPCNHFALCDSCLVKRQDCPVCHGHILNSRRDAT